MQEDELGEAFQRVMEEARQIEDISHIERSDAYEPLKAKIYELLQSGQADAGTIAQEALSWLRQRAQIIRSTNRVIGADKKPKLY